MALFLEATSPIMELYTSVNTKNIAAFLCNYIRVK
jgi:hypothetical protein